MPANACHRLQAQCQSLREWLSQAQPPSPDQIQSALNELLAMTTEVANMMDSMRACHASLSEASKTVRVLSMRYRELLDFWPDPCLATDRLGVIQEANAAASELLGDRHQRLIGKPLLLFIAPDHRQGTLMQIVNVHPGESGPRRLETHLLNHNGTPFPAEVHVAVACNDAGLAEWRRVLIRRATGP